MNYKSRLILIGRRLLDANDRRIIEALSARRVPFTQIARELGVAEGTVRYRVRQLARAGFLQVVA